jgi:hypothetical protein
MSRDPHPEGVAFHARVIAQIIRWHRLGLIHAPTRDTLLRYQRGQIAQAGYGPRATGDGPATPKPTNTNTDPSAATSTRTRPTTLPDPRPTKPTNTPPPRPDPTPLPLPDRPSTTTHSTFAVVGHFLRERTWWLVGAALTVVGSFFVAGTVWSDLGTIPRLVLVLLGLALYSQAFASLGHRLARQQGGRRAGRWLLGVSVALAPVLAMAAGSGWDVGGWTGPAFSGPALLAVTGMLALRLPRDLAALLPADSRSLVWIYLALSVGVGLLPLVSSPGWLLLPAALATLGLWRALTRWHRLPPAAALLLLHPLAFHAYLAPTGWSGAYGPTIALGALAVLYLDAALGRWRGVQALHLQGLRGVLALGLAGLALLLLLPGFSPLPSGPETAIVGLLLAPFFLGAALCWRRPILVHGALLALLLFTLALPDLFWAIVEPFRQLAKDSLGYSSEPLPLAWYSLTLLPYLLVCRLAAGGLRRSGWRQAEALSAHAWRWTFTLSLLLVVIAHTRGDDLRPALLALPLHGALWLREHRVRCLVSGSLPWVGLVVWTVDLLWYLGAGPELRLMVGAGLVALLVPTGRALADRLREHAVLRGARLVAVLASLGTPLLLAGWEAPALALACGGATVWATSLGLRPGGAPPSRGLLQLESSLAVLGQILLLAGGLVWALELEPGPLGWALGLELWALLALALAWWLPRVRRQVAPTCTALEVQAHALALAAVVALCWLEGWDRSLMKLPVAAMLAWWLVRSRHPVYGALLVFGVTESVLRRLWLLDTVEPGSLAVIATALAWTPAAALLLAKRAVPRFSIHWLHRGLGRPSALLGALSALAALPLILAAGAPGLELQLAAGALVVMLLGAASLEPARRISLELSAGITAIACATAWALGEPLDPPLPWLALMPVGLGLVALLWPSAERRGLTVAAIGASILVLAIHGPLASLHLHAAAAGGLTLLALRRGRGWAEAAILAWWLLIHAALAKVLEPELGWHLVTLLSVAAGLRALGLSEGRLPRLADAARHTGLALAVLAAVGWSAWLGWEAPRGDLGPWSLGLVAATALLWASHQGAWARLLAPWALSACLLSIHAEPILHPLAWGAFAAAAWLPSPRRASDRVGTRILATASALGLMAAALAEPDLHGLAAFGLAACGLLVTHTGSQHRWAWAGLAGGLLLAAATTPLEPVAIVLRSALAFTLVSSLRDLPGRPGHRFAPVLLWAVGLLALGGTTGAWLLCALGMAAGAVLLLREQRGLITRGPRLLEEPAGWLLLLGGVALRVFDQGGGAEWFLMAAAVPFLAWRQPRPWLFLASLPLLAWLPGEALGWDFTVAWPAALTVLGFAALALGDRLPAQREAALLCLGLGSGTALLTLLDRGAGAYLLLALPLGLGWWLARHRSLALLQLAAGLLVLSWDQLGPESGVPALVLLTTAVAAHGLKDRWTEALALTLMVPASLLAGHHHLELEPSPWQQLVLGAALLASLTHTLRGERPERWYASFGWGTLLLGVLVLWGPLAELPAKLWLPMAVGLGVLLEGGALVWEPRRGGAWVRPLRQATVALAALGLLAALPLGGVSSIGVALAGCLFCLRYVLREQRVELVLGVLLLDIATVMLHLRLGWTEPLAWVGPTGLSLLVIAQILRQGLDPRIRDALRWAGACCIYVTALGQAVFDPGWTLGLVLLSLAGLALGSLLRVRAFLFLGSAFLASALLTELLRFGLTNSQFWAFYLTTIGLTILGGMVALTLLRPQLATMRTRWRARLEDWE